MAEIPLEKLWEWWRELASRELSLESQYRPLLAEHDLVHRKRQALENLMGAQGEMENLAAEIAAEWENLRKRDELPPVEQKPIDVAYDVLSRNGSPMHYKAILAAAANAGAIIGGRDPGTTLIAYLGRDRRFAKAREVGRGFWKLKEWEK